MISNPDVGRWIVAFLHEGVCQRNKSPVENISTAVQPTIHVRDVPIASEGTLKGLTPVELAACNRVQQKAALAIERLCSGRDTALYFINLNCKFNDK